MPNQVQNSHDQVVAGWLKLWNGDYTDVERLIDPGFRVHAAMLDGGDGSAVTGPEGLVGWITLTRAVMPDLHFAIQVGPIEQGEHFVVRWIAEASYAGGFPGASAPVGANIAFTGTDILRVHGGLIAEYWVNSDMHVLLQQLQVVG
jgi:predicted ester cyclase